VDVRIIAATNRNLEAAVKEGRFREDLYYRINVVPIVLPPLRGRKEDVPALARFFMQRFSMDSKKNFSEISQEALDALQAYDWPGNVRELANVVERAVVLGQPPTLQIEDLSPGIAAAEAANNSGSTPVSYHQSVDEYRREVIVNALAQTQGNRAAAARLLGLQRSYLLRLMKAFDIA
jgi:Nif-specific regulatory protein